MQRRVVVTGMGMVTPLGKNTKTTWENLIAGKSGIGRLTRFNPGAYEAPPDFPGIAGEVKDFDPSQWGIDRKTQRKLDPFSQYALAAAIEAVLDAQIDTGLIDPLEIGVCLATDFGGATTCEEQFERMFNGGIRRVSPFSIPKYLPNMAAAGVATHYGFMGPNFSLTSACAAGSHSIGLSFDLIRNSRANIMLAGGSEAPLTSFVFAGFYRSGALSTRNEGPEKASRPFDSARNGFVMSEGAAVLILEELDHALSRGVEIYCEIIGFGMSADAHHITEPNPRGLARCIRLALRDGCIPVDTLGPLRSEVDYINAHATSTPLGDVSEVRAIKDVFGPKANDIYVGSTKSMTGHLLGAAGALEAGITALAIKHQIIPPNINLDNRDPECDLNLVPQLALQTKIDVALSNSSGFGGMNACLAFRKFEG